MATRRNTPVYHKELLTQCSAGGRQAPVPGSPKITVDGKINTARTTPDYNDFSLEEIECHADMWSELVSLIW